MEIIIAPGGRIRCLYKDELAGLLTEGRATVRRASHVEPAAPGGWTADMGPVGGPVLGPYRLRSEALAAEVKWLESRDIPIPA